MFLNSFFLLLSLEPFSWSEGARVRRLIAYFLFENKLALRKKFILVFLLRRCELLTFFNTLGMDLWSA